MSKNKDVIGILVSDAPQFIDWMNETSKSLNEYGLKSVLISDTSYCSALLKSVNANFVSVEPRSGRIVGLPSPLIGYGVSAELDRIEGFGFNRKYKSSLIDLYFGYYHAIYQTVVENGIVAIFSESVCGIYTQAAFEVCRDLNIDWLGFNYSRVEPFVFFEFDQINRVYFKEGEENARLTPDPTIEHHFQKISSLTPEYMKKGSPVYMGTGSFFRKAANLRRIKRILKSLVHSLRGVRTTYGMSPIYKEGKLVLRNTLRNIMNTWSNRLYHTELPSTKFVLYPCQFSPEASTSVHSIDYLNEVEFIKKLRLQTPYQVSVVVKEHPAFLGFRKIRDIKTIASLPNVVFLRSDYDLASVIANSECVVARSSTVAYQSILMGKQTYLAGNVYFKGLTGVHDFSAYNNKDWEAHSLVRSNLDDNLHELARIHERSFKVDTRGQNPINVGRQFAQAILSELKYRSDSNV